MSLYVDGLTRWPTGLWCHLVSDTSLAELDAFTQRAGITRRRHGDHYDLRTRERERVLNRGTDSAHETNRAGLLGAVNRMLQLDPAAAALRRQGPARRRRRALDRVLE